MGGCGSVGRACPRLDTIQVWLQQSGEVFIDPDGMFEWSDGYGTYDSDRSIISKGSYSGSYQATGSDLKSGSSPLATVVDNRKNDGQSGGETVSDGNGCCPEGGGDNKISNDSNTKNQNVSDLILTGVGTLGYSGAIISGNILISRSGYTSGKIVANSPFNFSKKTAGKINIGLRLGGVGLTLYGIIQTEKQFDKGEINQARRKLNHLNNGTGVVYPLLAIPLAGGDLIGQKYSEQITNQVAQPGGYVYESMKWLLEVLRIPTEKK